MVCIHGGLRGELDRPSGLPTGGGQTPAKRYMGYYGIRSTSGQYASYWNTFFLLYHLITYIKSLGEWGSSLLLIIPTYPLLFYCITHNMEVTTKRSSKMYTTPLRLAPLDVSTSKVSWVEDWIGYPGDRVFQYYRECGGGLGFLKGWYPLPCDLSHHACDVTYPPPFVKMNENCSLLPKF